MNTLFVCEYQRDAGLILKVLEQAGCRVEKADFLDGALSKLRHAERDLLIINVKGIPEEYILITRAAAQDPSCSIICIVPNQEVCNNIQTQMTPAMCVIWDEADPSESMEELRAAIGKHKQS